MLAYRCSEFLDLLHIPAILSSTLERKLAKVDVCYEGVFKVAEDERGFPRLVTARQLSAFDDIWVIPHTHLSTRSNLYDEIHTNAELRDALVQAFSLPEHTSFSPRLTVNWTDLVLDSGTGELFEAYWNWCFSCTVGLDDGCQQLMEIEWHVESREILMIPHADSPNVIVRALPPVIFETLHEDIFRHGASIVCLISSLEPGQMLKRDLLPKKRSRSRVARLLTLIGDMPRRWAHEGELSGLQQVNDCSSPLSGKYEAAKPTIEKADARPLAAMTEFTPTSQKVFSDHPSVHAYLTHPSFQLVTDFEPSDILFAANPVASFNNLGRRLVNQFPHEITLISPRRLLHAVRSVLHGQGDVSSTSVVMDTYVNPLELLPNWFPLSFDLKTEIKLFLDIYGQVPDPWWMLIGGDAGSLDWCVTCKTKTIVKYMEANDSNWVIQKLHPNPLLHEGHKIMLSMFLLVYAFDPMDTYLYKEAYATVASSPFSLDAAYVADETVQLPFEDHTQTVLSHSELLKVLSSKGINWEDLLEEVSLIVRELLISIQRQIGTSQRSRAVYRLDFHLPSVQEGVNFQPQLFRATFAPDLGVPSQSNPDFVNQVFEVLFLGGEFPEWFVSINDGLTSESDATDVTSSLQ